MNLKLNNRRDTKNEKKQIWMYALILFTGAFIVLLLTAYSQVKFQNNISEYQNKLSSQEKAKINAVTDFNSAMKENKRLKTEMEALRSKLVESEQKIATEEAKSADLESKNESAANSADLLLSAQELFIKEDYISCAVILKYDINTAYLSTKAVQTYHNLISESYPKASQLLYREGYRSYKKKDYADAILSLNRAIDFSQKNEYYIDDAYYYIAYSHYKTNNFEEAKKVISDFIVNYPESSFIKDMKALLNRLV